MNILCPLLILLLSFSSLLIDLMFSRHGADTMESHPFS